MPNNRSSTVGIISAIAFAVLALFAFTRQQQSANSEATAIVNAHSAATSQAISDSGQQTAVAQAQSQGTAQADAQNNQATAVAQANMQATGQAEAQNNEATAVAIAQMQANLAMTAQSEAEFAQAAADATGSAAEASIQRAATEVENQAATATVAMGQAIMQADLAQTAVRISIDSATAASEQQQAAQATGTAIRGQNAAIKQTATVQADALAITQTALVQMAATLQAPLTPVAQINIPPEDTMRFLVANDAIGTVGGHVAARLETSITLTGKDNWNQWEDFAGDYTDFVISADISWGEGAEEDQCGFILREQENENFYVLVFDRYGYINLVRRMDGEWHNDFPWKASSAIRTGQDDVNHVVMVVQKDEFLVYINDQPAGLYIDRNLDQGEVGAYATTYDESDKTGCNFANGWVWNLADDAPTLTPIPPTGVPTAAASFPAYVIPELAQTFTYTDQSFSVRYPAGWNAREYEDSLVRLSSTSRISALTHGNAPDEMLLFIWAAPETELEGRSLSELADDVISDRDDWDEPYDEIEFGEPDLFQMGDYEAVRVIGKSQDFDFEVIVFGKDKGVFIVEAVCGLGNIGRCEPILYAISATLTYRGNPDV